MSHPAVARYTSGAYRAQNPTWHDEHAAWKARHVVAMLRRHGLSPTRVAEVGCGAGGLLAAVHAAFPSADCTGYDIAPDAIGLAARRAEAGLRFVEGDLAVLPDAGFDLLLAIDVVEHVEDAYGFLRALRTRAKYAVFHIPLDLSAQSVLRRDGLMRPRRRVGHLHYFTAETALALLDESGYSAIDWRYTRGGIEQPQAGVRGWLAWPRRAFCLFGEGFAARLLGGFSLLVLTRTG